MKFVLQTVSFFMFGLGGWCVWVVLETTIPRFDGVWGFLLMIVSACAGPFISGAVFDSAERSNQKVLEMREHQNRINSRFAKLNDDIAANINYLPKFVDEAERTISLAEHEFQEGAFAPFWDAVESAAKELGSYNSCVTSLASCSREYGDLRKQITPPPPPLSIEVYAIPDATRASERLRLVVRQAQKNPNFAAIYEMRRNNRILVAGFGSLREALAELSSTIHDSLADLHASVSDQLGDIARLQTTTIETSREEHEKDREHHDKLRGTQRDNK